MKLNTFRRSALALIVTALLGACTLISEVDRSKIADETPPSGMGGESGDGDGDGDMGDGDGDNGDGDGDGDMGGGGGAGGAGGASN